MFSAVPKQVIDVVWDDVVKVLKPAVDTAKGKLGINDIKEYLSKGLYELWVVMDGTKIIAAITTRIIEYPERKALAMDFIGGTRMKEWLPEAQSTIVQFANDNNCSHLEGYGFFPVPTFGSFFFINFYNHHLLFCNEPLVAVLFLHSIDLDCLP